MQVSLPKVEIEEQIATLLLFLNKGYLKTFSTLVLFDLVLLHLYAFEGHDIPLPAPATENCVTPLASQRQNCTADKHSLDNVPG